MKLLFKLCGLFCLVTALILTVKTRQDMLPVADTLNVSGSTISKPQLLDRRLSPITITYKNHWNMHDNVPLHQVPEFLQQAFIYSEDQRFYKHNGADWTARFHAVLQNISAMTKVRGASTISEQTIKMLHPRPRTIWTRWLEGFEAQQLEQRFSKNEILEFYLNQVPYSAQRRGVVQAAKYYFDRDLDTLNQQEMLTLAVMVRAPSRLDPLKNSEAAKPAVARLVKLINQHASDNEIKIADEKISESNQHSEYSKLNSLSINKNHQVRASHFAKYIYENNKNNTHTIHTTIDLNLQAETQKILETRLNDIKEKNVKNGAVLIVDHSNNEILSWVVAGDSLTEYPGGAIDAVITPRQPGSTLKPLLYTIALEQVLTAATLIDDSPLRESVGVGMHTYHNYSRLHYGPISIREALGNSLNIPAIKTLQLIGTENFLKILNNLGIKSLDQHPDIYGDGLALGNGEITLYELVQAYTTLARHGQFMPLRSTHQYAKDQNTHSKKRVFNKESSSLIANILSDKSARTREFGRGGLLNFPIQTAVKTGTSNDYRDSWAVGFNHKYTVGVWMGNMDRSSTKKVTGSVGPAYVLRSIFAELNQHQDSKALYLSPKLVKETVCKETGHAPIKSSITEQKCTPFNEWFIPGTLPKPDQKLAHNPSSQSIPIRIQQPSPNLQMAMDPRIPDDKEQFKFTLNQTHEDIKVKWFLDEQLLAETTEASYEWALERGQHRLRAEVVLGDELVETVVVGFLVK